jgi:hypothetical protein
LGSNAQYFVDRRFGVKYNLYQARKKKAESESKQNFACYLIHAGFLRGLFFDLEDGGDMSLRNVGQLSLDYTALYPFPS